jgi:16S rRNA (uracil1498-N3)-methyltransferase
VTIRAPIAGLAPGEHALDAQAVHYLVRVLRLGVGARFVAFDPARALEADGELVQIEPAAARFGALRPARVVAPRELVLVQALAKGDKCDAVIRDATELGATRVVIAATARSVVHLDGTRARARRERWSKIAREAARQCGRADPPAIEGPLGWHEALACAPEGAARFCLHPAAHDALGPLLLEALASRSPIAFAVGPEGGLTDDEIAQASEAGWRLATIGALVLRTETVAAAVLGATHVHSARP